MTKLDMLQLIVYFVVLTGLAIPLGAFMSKVFLGQRHFLHPILGWLERLVYRTTGIDPYKETNWKSYFWNLILFNGLGFVVVFLFQLIQQRLPLNPAHCPNVPWPLAFNTSVSFVTNTNWQSYAGETTLSYWVQMVGLTVQNFVSSATGIAVFLAITRGIIRKSTQNIGNFWVDITRSIIYVLLPLSIILAVLLTSQGVIQNFRSYEHVQTLQGEKQEIPMGPAASQIAIKQLGTNGGGFFNANSAHPYENPTPLSNFLEMLSILLIPAALTFTYGKFLGAPRQGWAVFSAMMILLMAGLAISLKSEFSWNGMFGHLPLLEGKETRFGITNSILWMTATTAASNGSVNAMHDSLSPVAGLIAVLNIMLGEVIFGGVGAGLYGMIIFIILTVFIAGLMVGRTPEYMGKKIEAFEVQMSILAVLAPSLVILVFSAWDSVSQSGLEGIHNAGPHGFSEILYAFSSAAGNNGSALAGLNANTDFYNIMLGIGMIIGRYGVILPVMAIAGSLAAKKSTPFSAGTFKTDNGLFIGLLIAVIIMIAGLTFFPALALGPIVDHILMNMGIGF